MADFESSFEKLGYDDPFPEQERRCGDDHCYPPADGVPCQDCPDERRPAAYPVDTHRDREARAKVRAAQRRRRVIADTPDTKRAATCPSCGEDWKRRPGTPAGAALWLAEQCDSAWHLHFAHPVSAEGERWICAGCDQPVTKGHVQADCVEALRKRLAEFGLPCPDAEVCKTCPCAAEDDACFPGERLRAELAAAEARAAEAERERDALAEAYHEELEAMFGRDFADLRIAHLLTPRAPPRRGERWWLWQTSDSQGWVATRTDPSPIDGGLPVRPDLKVIGPLVPEARAAEAEPFTQAEIRMLTTAVTDVWRVQTDDDPNPHAATRLWRKLRALTPKHPQDEDA